MIPITDALVLLDELLEMSPEDFASHETPKRIRIVRDLLSNGQAQQQPQPVFWYDPVLADKLDTRWSDFMSDQEDPQCNVPLYRFPPSVALLIAERESQLFEARQTIIKEGLARDAAEKRVGELEEKLAVLLAIQRKILASETAPATPAPATATSGHLR